MKCPKCGSVIAFVAKDDNGKRFLIDDIGNWIDDIDTGAENIILGDTDLIVCNDCGYEGKLIEFEEAGRFKLSQGEIEQFESALSNLVSTLRQQGYDDDEYTIFEKILSDIYREI